MISVNVKKGKFHKKANQYQCYAYTMNIICLKSTTNVAHCIKAY